MAAFFSGCGASDVGGNATTTPDLAPAPDAARITCGPDGTRVLTPKVRARPDGVHLAIENRFERKTGYSVEFDGGGTGADAPVGETRRVENIPPGEARIRCDGSNKGGYAPLQVFVGDSGYKPVALECLGGRAVGVQGSYGPGTEAAKGNPVDITRRALKGRLREGDVVESAGYPEATGYRTVRVVRERRVIATSGYFREGGGWFPDASSNCEGF